MKTPHPTQSPGAKRPEMPKRPTPPSPRLVRDDDSRAKQEREGR